MAKKQAVIWHKTGKMGNWLAQWHLVIVFEDVSLDVCHITQFEKGEYCLPTRLFPRDNNFMPLKTKTLSGAKYKCEAYLKRMSFALNDYFKEKK